MRFLSNDSEVTSPRRRRPGVGYQSTHPPVLARLPEIKPNAPSSNELATSEALSDDLGSDDRADLKSEQRKFRLDSAHALANDASLSDVGAALSSENPIATVVADISDPLFVTPTVAALPTAGFAESATKIIAEINASEPQSSQPPIVSSAVAAMQEAADIDPSSMETTMSAVANRSGRELRVDAGMPRQVPSQPIEASEEFAEKRRMARGQSQLQIATLDSPWHDWIVKLGGTFLAGMLLLMAYQAARPHLNANQVTTDAASPEATGVAPLRVATAPETLSPIDVANRPATPDFFQGEKPAVLQPELDIVATADNSNNEVVALPVEKEKPGFGYRSIDNPIAEDFLAGDLSVNRNKLPKADVLDDLVADLMPAPAVNNNFPTPTAKVADRPNPKFARQESNPSIVENPLVTPIRTASRGYPATGYAEITRVKPQPKGKTPASVEQPLIPEPDVSLYSTVDSDLEAPTRSTLSARSAATATPSTPDTTKAKALNKESLFSNPMVNLSGNDDEPKSPLSVQLNGTIQKFSR